MLKTYRSWYLIVFAGGIFFVEGALILFACVALIYESTPGVISSLVTALLVFPTAKLISTLLGLRKIASFQTDGETWLRIYGDGSDRRISKDDFQTVKRTPSGIRAETVERVVEIPNHTLNIDELWKILASWSPECRGNKNTVSGGAPDQ